MRIINTPLTASIVVKPDLLGCLIADLNTAGKVESCMFSLRLNEYRPEWVQREASDKVLELLDKYRDSIVSLSINDVFNENAINNIQSKAKRHYIQGVFLSLLEGIKTRGIQPSFAELDQHYYSRVRAGLI